MSTWRCIDKDLVNFHCKFPPMPHLPAGFDSIYLWEVIIPSKWMSPEWKRKQHFNKDMIVLGALRFQNTQMTRGIPKFPPIKLHYYIYYWDLVQSLHIILALGMIQKMISSLGQCTIISLLSLGRNSCWVLTDLAYQMQSTSPHVADMWHIFLSRNRNNNMSTCLNVI